MSKKDISQSPSILEAVDNLSSMVELNLEELVTDKEDGSRGVQLRTSRWLDPRNDTKTIDSVKNTLKVVHDYLKHVYTKEGKQLRDKEMQGGVKSIIALANEAVKKIDECSSFFKFRGSITDTKEYRDLIEFYEKKILTKFEETLSTEEKWEEEQSVKEDAADIERRGLKDLETVTRDRDYELFYIVKEDGSKFYNRNLIRHIRLVSDFDGLINSISGEDPLLRVKTLQDRFLVNLAIHLKRKIRSNLDHILSKAGKYREDYIVQLFFQGVMALFLAANPKNSLAHTIGKSSYSYFSDFKKYLRQMLESEIYKQYLENQHYEEDPFYRSLLDLIHQICFELFTAQADQSDAMALFMRIVGADSKEHKTSSRSSLSLWNKVLDDSEALSNQLQKYPSGPLFKVLDLIHDEGHAGFDPYMQDDLPQALYGMHINGKKIHVLSFACPTTQKKVDKAEVIPEFFGMMRFMKEHKHKMLIVNFQDRTSWKEYARCKVVEEYQKNAEVHAELDVLTLSKTSDFYLQASEYIRQSDATIFKNMLLEQLESEETCGFYFPKSTDRKKLFAFAKKAIDVIDACFFGEKEVFSRKNRLDFIEIFYQFLIFYFLIESHASYLAFSAKDTVDIPSTSSATFFAFTRLLRGDTEWREEEKDFFLSLIFLPALLIRERAVDIKHLSRSISMLSIISGEVELDLLKVQKGVDSLFAPKFSKGLTFEEITRA